MSIINLTRPYSAGPLIRLGNKHDGGYVVNKGFLSLTNILYTYGVADEVSFEKDLLNLHPFYKIHLYDHTVTQFPHLNGDVLHHREGLSNSKTPNCNSFFSHLKINNDENNLVFLKIDTEGAEFDFFKNVNYTNFVNVVQMIVEFHLLDMEKISDFANIIEKLNEFFYCVHIHGNNGGKIIPIFNDQFPEVPEITFINKKYICNVPELYKGKLPINDLDYPNVCIDKGHKQWEVEYK